MGIDMGKMLTEYKSKSYDNTGKRIAIVTYGCQI